ncbi:hypothetical protein FOB84_04865 [Gordonia bronchialis]|nr:hypothetical protein FOB84_04865 [Gordonia bronchialis]UAK40561.1 hypothetical protein K8O93_11780 [Gordonia bronchialis]
MLTVAAAVTVVALVVALIAAIGTSRVDDGVTESERTTVLRAAETAITALMNFGPETTPDDARRTGALLADPLALDFRARGYDVMVGGAIATGVRVQSRVVGAGLHSYSDERARVLVFLDQQLRPGRGAAEPDGDLSGTAPTARWAAMRKVDGNWLLADLQPVGDITR